MPARSRKSQNPRQVQQVQQPDFIMQRYKSTGQNTTEVTQPKPTVKQTIVRPRPRTRAFTQGFVKTPVAVSGKHKKSEPLHEQEGFSDSFDDFCYIL